MRAIHLEKCNFAKLCVATQLVRRKCTCNVRLEPYTRTPLATVLAYAVFTVNCEVLRITLVKQHHHNEKSRTGACGFALIASALIASVLSA